jgi:hypothetical protein
VHGLWIKMAPNQRIGVLDAGCEDTDPHLTPAGRGQRSIGYLESFGIAEVRDLNNPVARLVAQIVLHSG